MSICGKPSLLSSSFLLFLSSLSFSFLSFLSPFVLIGSIVSFLFFFFSFQCEGKFGKNRRKSRKKKKSENPGKDWNWNWNTRMVGWLLKCGSELIESFLFSPSTFSQFRGLWHILFFFFFFSFLWIT